MKRYFFFFFASLVLVASDEAVDYLNALRLSAGVQPVAIDDALTLAAQHHSEYMQMHHVVSHVEEKGKEGFFGKTPRQRAHNAGRFSLRISETISVGDVSGTASIDRLMAAIYHRLVMLDPMIDRIGMGQRALFYTYDMGVSAIEDACAHGDGASNKELALCGNGTFVDADRYRTIVQQAYDRLPDRVVWPADRQADIPPVFYDETPDPLPNVSVSGYPLSVVLNQTRFRSPATLLHFALHDAQGNTVAMLTEMNATNDSHHLHHDTTTLATSMAHDARIGMMKGQTILGYALVTMVFVACGGGVSTEKHDEKVPTAHSVIMKEGAKYTLEGNETIVPKGKALILYTFQRQAIADHMILIEGNASIVHSGY